MVDQVVAVDLRPSSVAGRSGPTVLMAKASERRRPLRRRTSVQPPAWSAAASWREWREWRMSTIINGSPGLSTRAISEIAWMRSVVV